jgi:hypothetical protein
LVYWRRFENISAGEIIDCTSSADLHSGPEIEFVGNKESEHKIAEGEITMGKIPQIQAYFDVKSGDVRLVEKYFADNICIEDTGEDKTIRGVDDCKKWLVENNRKYELKTEIVETTEQGNGNVKASVLVTGNFAASAYPFDYYFTISDEKITKVKILYTGE